MRDALIKTINWMQAQRCVGSQKGFRLDMQDLTQMYAHANIKWN